MSDHALTLDVLAETLAICRLDAQESIPAWAIQGEFISITRTAEELSIVCPVRWVPAWTKGDGGWRTRVTQYQNCSTRLQPELPISCANARVWGIEGTAMHVIKAAMAPASR